MFRRTILQQSNKHSNLLELAPSQPSFDYKPLLNRGRIFKGISQNKWPLKKWIVKIQTEGYFCASTIVKCVNFDHELSNYILYSSKLASNFSFIDNLKKPACASPKKEGLVLATLIYGIMKSTRTTPLSPLRKKSCVLQALKKCLYL